MITYVLLVFLPVFLLLWMWITEKRLKDTSKYMKNVPGPKPTFPLGNMLDFAAGSKVYLKVIERYMKQYGDTIIVHDGCFSWLVVTIDYEFTEYLYSSTTHIDKSDQYNLFYGWLGDGLLTSTGTKWKKHRKAITPSFHFSILQQFIEIFENVGNNLITKLESEEGKDSVEISKIISLYALDVICEAAMGVKVNALEGKESDYIKHIKQMCSVFVTRAFSPLGEQFYPFTSTCYKEKESLKVIHRYIENVISQRKEERQKGSLSDKKKNSESDGIKKRLAFLDLLLDLKIDGQPLSMRDLRDEVNTFMFEGHDTTASAIMFCLFMLANNPEVQKKAVAEQHDIFGEDCSNATATFSNFNEMKYLDLVIKETLRLYPSVPFYARKLAEDVELKGTIYPKGMRIVLIPFLMHRNPKYFKDPEQFIPERFEDKSKRLPSYAYTPFSAGARNCIGQKFAVLEMLSVVSKVLRKYELLPAKPKHELQLASETILISKNGVRISFRKRL